MRVWPSLLLTLAAVAPAMPAAGCQPDAEVAARAINALRAQARSCGARLMPAAPALRWQATLDDTARRHAADIAARDRLDHLSASGASLRARLHEAGYLMRLSGENLAGGGETLDETLGQWLASPAHCENLMLADFQEFGLACAPGAGQLQRYWVLELAAPLAQPPARSSPGRSP